LQVLHVAPAARGVLLDGELWVESGMMVLLLKQVHLQNEGGAGAVSLLVNPEERIESSQAASTDIINAKSVRRI
jgi:hypothetical protein